MDFPFSIGPPGAMRTPPPLTGLDYSGQISYRRVDGPEICSGDLAVIDSYAFVEEYNGQHDSPLAAAGRLVTASTAIATIGYALALPLGDDMDPPWFIDTVAVLTDRRAEGIGQRLIGEVAAWLREGGVPRVSALPLYGADQDRRHRWLLRLGFVDSDGDTVASTDTLAKLIEPNT